MTTNDSPDVLASRMNAFIENQIPVMHRLGIRILDLREGSVVGAAPLAGNVNHLGTMYAGTLFGLAEALGGGVFFANFDLRRYTATVRDVQIRYRRPAATDVRAEASLDTATIARIKQEADAAGKAEFELETQLTDTAGVVVATTRGTYQVYAAAHARRSSRTPGI
jgi:thioesterase domain-containing protein